MRVPTDANLGLSRDLKDLSFRVGQIFRAFAQQLNGLSEGRIEVATNAATAAPTTGTYKQGDFILNSAPAEAGSAGSKYIIHGWRCTVSGTPGTWVACRFLTGN